MNRKLQGIYIIIDLKKDEMHALINGTVPVVFD
jgi:hypothetical protein